MLYTQTTPTDNMTQAQIRSTDKSARLMGYIATHCSRLRVSVLPVSACLHGSALVNHNREVVFFERVCVCVYVCVWTVLVDVI